MFGGVEGRIAQIVYGIPAVKGVEFGIGFAAAALRGSQNNDDFRMEDGRVVTATNHCGGILGGITSGIAPVDVLIVFALCAVVMIVCVTLLHGICARLRVEQVFKFYWTVVTGLALVSLILAWFGL